MKIAPAVITILAMVPVASGFSRTNETSQTVASGLSRSQSVISSPNRLLSLQLQRDDDRRLIYAVRMRSDREGKEMIDRYQSILREAAGHRIMVNFHGANKPAGESRTWPNELTREAVQGLEHRSMPEWSRHNTTLPFTRFLAGAADYTPVVFGDRRKETSWAHQIATAAVFTSPLLVYGAHPESLLKNPAVELIKSLPSVWDKTVVLPQSEIGELAAFARQRGDTWFLAVLNGPAAKPLSVDLGFLGSGRYDALFARDRAADAAALQMDRSIVVRSDSVTMELRSAGGFLGRFVPMKEGRERRDRQDAQEARR